METTHDVDEPQRPKTKATVLEVVQESETIKRIVLKVEGDDFSFKAGQWVDFFIPGVSIFTGFSMCSPPHLLEDSGRLELAVKYSDYPPTLWIHTECKVGDEVEIRVGGNFFYEITPHAPVCDLLLLAAGIGINPMYSIYQHFMHTQHKRHLDGQSAGTKDGGRMCLLYSARTPEELVFRNPILAMAKTSSSNVDVQLFCTRNPIGSKAGENITDGRITISAVKNHMVKLDKGGLQAYICGPPGFIDDMEKNCVQEGLGPKQIHFEKWW